MNYFSIEFHYSGPKGMGADESFNDSPIHKALADAEIHVVTKLAEAGIDWRHEYSWPDGSLYKFVRSNLPREELLESLRKLINKDDVNVASVTEISPNKDPLKHDFSTVKSYFEDTRR